MNAPEGLLLILVILLGAGLLWRGRILERRIAALERSLGAFAGLGGGVAGRAGDEEVLEHLLAINDGLLQEIKSPEGSRRRNEEN